MMAAVLAASLGIVILTFARRAASRRHGRRRKCHDCQHLRRKFDDGVMCGYGAREVFKTLAHISMCSDWSPAPRGRR